ncbi:MAG: adenylate/guanylate cyclase domain-containing protein [Dehalococcoidia bacterium]|nr:adenylate/guanylate cyclase domain-containing protein [Dehalococcoidia bacterium]
MEPQIRFCTSADGTRIAYAVLGEGPATPVICVNSWAWTIEAIMTQPAERARLADLAERHQVVTFDNRGTGASEREPSELSLESRVADLGAVADRLGWPRFHLVGYGDGGATAAAYTARNPERVARLVLFSPCARGDSNSERMTQLIHENWSWARRMIASLMFPNGPAEMQRWTSSTLRQSMSPNLAARALELNATLDIADLLPRVQAPTLVLNFRDGPGMPEGREVAALIPDARFHVLPGEYASVFAGADELIRAIREFLDEGTEARGPDIPSGTAVILFADIVDSTALTERLGDTAFREKARELDGALRTVIRENGGTPIDGKLLGDGVLAVFTSARQAIEAALRCGKAGGNAGLPLHLGLHAGDVIREENNVYGGAVNIASRISGLSAPGEVLVSETVRSLARTSAGVRFEDRGEQALKGVGEPLRVWAVVEGGV